MTKEEQRKYQAKWKRERYKLNRDENLAHQRQYRLDNLDRIRERDRRYYAKCRDRKLELLRIRRRDNPEKFRAIDRNRKVHRASLKKARYHCDIQFKLKGLLRTRLYRAVKSQKARKSSTMGQLLGCSIGDLLIYLESKFEQGMTWENYGKVWHVDHVMPCAIFNLTKTEHQKRCFHFSNLQPLFAKDNQIKHDKIITNQFNLL